MSLPACSEQLPALSLSLRQVAPDCPSLPQALGEYLPVGSA
jgi:hypothetical protein